MSPPLRGRRQLISISSMQDSIVLRESEVRCQPFIAGKRFSDDIKKQDSEIRISPDQER